MTTLTPARPALRVTQLRVLHSEWTKLRSLASTAWCLLATVALVVGVGAVYSLLRVTRPPRQPEAIAAFDPTAVSLSGVQLAQLGIGVLGVLLITGEYATGAIRTTFTAVPRRLPVLWGKAAVFSVTSIVVCLPAAVAAFLVSQSILSAEHLDTGFGQAAVARAVVGSALYLAGVGLIGLSLGGLLRSTAGAVSALFGILFAPQIVVGFLPGSWSDHIYGYLPVPAGLAITTVHTDAVSLTPWSGFGVFCLYAAILLALAAWRMSRRDA